MSSLLPVAIGLIAGIGFILLFSITFETGHKVAIVRMTENANGEIAFEPKVIAVFSGVNNTVRWVNVSNLAALLKADNESDPAFYNATKDFVFILPHKSYEYTFTGLGKIDYHGKPWQKGSVIVVSALPVK